VIKLVAPDLNWVVTTAAVGIVSVLISLPVYHYVELPVLKAKLKFSAEKEALDLRTGKMVRTDGSDAPPPVDASPPTDAPTTGT